jgi:hypothetical protein
LVLLTLWLQPHLLQVMQPQHSALQVRLTSPHPLQGVIPSSSFL